MVKVSINNKVEGIEKLQKIALKICQKLGLTPDELTVTFLDINAMKKLHEKHLNDCSDTDIMTFDLRDEYGHCIDLYIGEESLKEQSCHFRVSEEEECQRLIIHGLLHCAGYDDQNPEDKDKMFMVQEKLLKEIQDENE